MNCFHCGAKISNGAISARRRGGVAQCPRLRYLWRCGQCKQTINYQSLIKHRELFKNTLIEINHTFPRPKAAYTQNPILQFQVETFYNYKNLLKHRQLFKNTLIEMNPHIPITPYPMPYTPCLIPPLIGI